MELNYLEDVPPKASKVKITHVITTSSFWVISDSFPSKKGDLHRMEENLCLCCSRARWDPHYFPTVREDTKLREDLAYQSAKGGFEKIEEFKLWIELKVSTSLNSVEPTFNAWVVAVQESNSKRWFRGKIIKCALLKKLYLYSVFLIDHGTFLNVTSKFVRLLPDKMKLVTPQAYQVQIYGTIPTTIDLDYNEMKMKRIISDMWTPASLDFVTNLIHLSREAFIVDKLQRGDFKRHAELFLCINENYINLGKELCDKEYAVYHSSMFEDLIDAGLNDTVSETNDSEALSVENVLPKEEIPNIKEQINNFTDSLRTNDITQFDSDSSNFSSVTKLTNKVVDEKSFLPVKSDLRNAKDKELFLDLINLLKNHKNKGLKCKENENKDDLHLNKVSEIVECSKGADSATNELTVIEKNVSGNYKHLDDSIEIRSSTRKLCDISLLDLLRKHKNETKNNAELLTCSAKATEVDQLVSSKLPPANNLNKYCVLPNNKICDDVLISKQPSGINNWDMSLLDIFRKHKSINNESQNCQIQKDSLSVMEKDSYEPESVIVPSASSEHKFNQYGHTKTSLRLLQNIILVHGQNRNYKPVSSIAEVNFAKEIHEALYHIGIITPFRIQTYVWPAILRGYSMIVVNPPKSGKTFSYAVPLVSFLYQESMYKSLPPGNGPVSLILCPSSSGAQRVGDICRNLCSQKSKYKVIVTHGGGAEEERMIDLVNGCDILISTPRCLLRLLQRGNVVTSLTRLCHLVLDDVDVMAFKYLQEIKNILHECKQMLGKRSSNIGISIQVIAVSEKWCGPIKSFAEKIITDPIICIGSYLEAAIYAELKPKLHIIEKSKKVQLVMDIMKMNKGLYKTVIACESAKDCNELFPSLSSVCDNVLLAHEDMPHYIVEDVFCKWKELNIPGSYPTILCSDTVLYDFKIQDASWLIHYTLPTTSKSKFGFRFSCLMKSFKDRFSENQDIDRPDCEVHILIYEENSRQLPSVVQFMKRLGGTVCPQLEAVSAEILRKKDESKEFLPLCYNLKAFGDCWNKTLCPNRHTVIKPLDCPKNIPVNGVIKFKILHEHDASYYSVRLLEHTDLNGNTKELVNDYIKINMKLLFHFKDENNRILHGIPKVNDVCVVECGINFYKRVKVMAITKEDSRGNAVEVEVKFLDEGFYQLQKIHTLLALPKELADIAPQATDLFVSHLSPCDLDWSWSHTASQTSYDWLETVSKPNKNSFMKGRVLLSLDNSIWVDTIECEEWLPSVETFSVVMSLRKKLLEHQFAVDNPRHLEKIYLLCENAGFTLPKYFPEPQNCEANKKIEFQPQWAYFPEESSIQVSFMAADSPDQIFVNIMKWKDSYNKLHKDIQNYAQESNTKRINFYIGYYCIGKFPANGMWYRAQITKEVGDKFELFFVDFGDRDMVSKDDIKPANKTLLEKLPFQAIECELAAVSSISTESWINDATDMLYDLLYEEDGKAVKLKVCEKYSKAAKCTGGHKYKVILIDNTKNAVVINKHLIDIGVVSINKSDAHYLEEENFTETEKEKNSDDEEIWFEDDENDSNKSQSASCTLAEPKMKPLQNTEFEHVNDFENSDLILDFKKFVETEEDLQDLIEFSSFFIQGMKVSEKKGNESTTENPPSIKEIDGQEATQGTKWKQNSIEESTSEVEQKETTTTHKFKLLPLLKLTRTPNIKWHQNAFHVWMQINIVGVERYYIEWNSQHVEFCAETDDMYFFNIDLYGPIIPHELSHCAKGLTVEVKITKVVKGFEWPKLTKSDEKSWITVNFDFVETLSNDDTYEGINNILPINGMKAEENDGDCSDASEIEDSEMKLDHYDPWDC